MKHLALLLLAAGAPAAALAQQHDMDHAQHMAHDAQMAPAGQPALAAPREGGQAAFAAIAEITAILMADPATDWARADIAGLRQHLIDMDNVTLRADVASEEIEGGSRFRVTSADPEVAASIRAMVIAHTMVMNGVEGWTLQAEEIDGGAQMTATGADPLRIRGLGFIGLMTVGVHHQAHHLALARGLDPHAH